jgi:hypothetical protein
MPTFPFSWRLVAITGGGETVSGNVPLPTLGIAAVIVASHVSLELSYRLPDTPFGLPKALDQ